MSSQSLQILGKYLRKPCDRILIAATVRRQPISLVSGKVPDLLAQLPALACCIDGAGAAVMEICGIFESS
jgi:hypothetical protein